MRVSVTLHRAEPDLDGNQREFEAEYCGYNRGYTNVRIDPKTGDGFFAFEGMTFPRVQADPETLTHFSLGVCDAPADQGGSIIIAGILAKPIVADVGTAPILEAAGGINAARLAAMLADGRLFTTD